MKRDIGRFVTQYLTFQQVKAEYCVLADKVQSLPILEWKWDHMTIDFVVGLLRAQSGEDAVWVIVDRLTKSTHFLPAQVNWPLERLEQLYLDEVMRLHGVPASIVLDRDLRFVSHFWRSLQTTLGTQLHFNTAFHSQNGVQSKKTIQILVDLRRACVLNFGGGWYRHLGLAEFAYNKSYQARIQMAPFEALYRRKCRSPLHWSYLG